MYNPSDHKTINQPFGMGDIPINGKTLFYDKVKQVYRPFLTVDELDEYFADLFKTPDFESIVNTGGILLVSGKIEGGINDAYWFPAIGYPVLKTTNIIIGDYYTKAETDAKILIETNERIAEDALKADKTYVDAQDADLESRKADKDSISSLQIIELAEGSTEITQADYANKDAVLIDITSGGTGAVIELEFDADGVAELGFEVIGTFRGLLGGNIVDLAKYVRSNVLFNTSGEGEEVISDDLVTSYVFGLWGATTIDFTNSTVVKRSTNLINVLGVQSIFFQNIAATIASASTTVGCFYNSLGVRVETILKASLVPHLDGYKYDVPTGIGAVNLGVHLREADAIGSAQVKSITISTGTNTIKPSLLGFNIYDFLSVDNGMSKADFLDEVTPPNLVTGFSPGTYSSVFPVVTEPISATSSHSDNSFAATEGQYLYLKGIDNTMADGAVSLVGRLFRSDNSSSANIPKSSLVAVPGYTGYYRFTVPAGVFAAKGALNVVNADTPTAYVAYSLPALQMKEVFIPTKTFAAILVSFNKDAGNGTFFVYVLVSDKEGYYIRFDIPHIINMSTSEEYGYIDYWRIEDAHLYQYVDGVMVDQGIQILNGGESETAYKTPLASDFTGGYHGCEIMESASFLVDGVPYTDFDTSFFYREATEFAYIEKSTMYQTAAGLRTPVLPVVPEATHYKRTKFGDRGYITENKLVWLKNTDVQIWYFALCSIGTSVGDFVYNSEFEIVETTHGSEVDRLEAPDEPTIWLYSDANKISASAEGHISHPAGLDVEAVSRIKDNSNYNKYYRQVSDKSPLLGDVWKGTGKYTFTKKVS
jgi:hypothetical protein